MTKEIDFICEIFKEDDTYFLQDLYELTVEQGVKDYFKIMRAKYADRSEEEILEYLVGEINSKFRAGFIGEITEEDIVKEYT